MKVWLLILFLNNGTEHLYGPYFSEENCSGTAKHYALTLPNVNYTACLEATGYPPERKK